MSEFIKLKRLSIACGGTGGHFYPGLSVAREFKSSGGNVLLILSGKNAGLQSGHAESKGIDSVVLPPARAPISITDKIVFLFNLFRDVMSCIRIFRKFRPDAFLAMGSFNCIAPALSALLLGIPLFVHDGNARVGKANLFLSKFCKILFLSFPAANPEKIHGRHITTGMPIRHELLEELSLSRSEAISIINSKYSASFVEEIPIVLVFGGSQGASSLNSNVPKALMSSSAEGAKFQVVHLCGFNNLDKVKKNYSGSSFPLVILESSEEMHILYAAADVVISRAGGSTIAELACFAKFAILVPYPFASENHQLDNARHYALSGAAIVIEDSELESDHFKKIVREILCSDISILHKKAALGKALALPDASKTILRTMETYI